MLTGALTAGFGGKGKGAAPLTAKRTVILDRTEDLANGLADFEEAYIAQRAADAARRSQEKSSHKRSLRGAGSSGAGSGLEHIPPVRFSSLEH